MIRGLHSKSWFLRGAFACTLALAGVAAVAASRGALARASSRLSLNNGAGVGAQIRNVFSSQGTLQTPKPVLRPLAGSALPKIAFGSVRNSDNHDIFVIDADGSNEIRLTTDLAYDDQPTWSPDGNTLAFISDRNATSTFTRCPATAAFPLASPTTWLPMVSRLVA